MSFGAVALHSARRRNRVVDTLSRVLPWLWPYRRQIVLSVLCACAISFLWAANLSAVMPLVQVLFNKESIHENVQRQISSTEQEIESRKSAMIDLRRDDHERLAHAQADQSMAAEKLLQLQRIRDYVLPWVPRDNFNTIALILGGLVLATLLKGIFIYGQEVLVGSVVNRTTINIRQALLRRALSLDFQTLASNGSSNLMSRMTNDVEILSAGMKTLLIRLIREPLKAGGCIAFAFFFNWRLTLMTLLVVPAIGFVFHRFGKSLKRASHGTLESMSGIFRCLSETFESIKVVFAFGMERKHRQKFHRANKEYYEKSMKVIRVAALTRPTTELIGVVAVLAAVLPGTYLVLRETDSLFGLQLSNGPLQIAELATLYALLAGTLDSIRKLSSVYGELKRSSAASERIFEILDQTTTVPEPEMPRVVSRHSSQIQFENISFTYKAETIDGETRPPALRNVDLTVQAGEVVAVIGENGSGKSTLINLLPRFYDPDHGSVKIDGVDIRQMRTRDLRSQIGMVTQETLLFDESIFDNIRYGRSTATWEDVEEAARQAHVIPFVTQLPDGFDTKIGDKGQKLSGGQRQRIALARAIVRDPSILILDEATSAVDAQSEQLIHRVLKSFVKDRSVFIITHVINDTFLDLVTRIVVLDQGRVVVSGTHEELLAESPIYQRLYHASAQDRAA